jgi:hypothetical protein
MVMMYKGCIERSTESYACPVCIVESLELVLVVDNVAAVSMGFLGTRKGEDNGREEQDQPQETHLSLC